MRIKIGVTAEKNSDRPKAANLATKLGLDTTTLTTDTYPFLLVVTPNRIELRQSGAGAPGPVYADFVSGRSAYRRRYGGGRRELLARAVGVKHGRSPKVIDATAGLGRDAFVLATLGCTLTLLERSPIIALLLSDAIERAQEAPEVKKDHTAYGAENAWMQIEYLNSEVTPEEAEVIYLDPMYPRHRKQALVKKEMRLFRQLIGEDADSSKLLCLAREIAKYRVVVKRPAGSEYIGGEIPSVQHKGPNTRYDLYINRGFQVKA